jgi:hypothetical protein
MFGSKEGRGVILMEERGEKIKKLIMCLVQIERKGGEERKNNSFVFGWRKGKRFPSKSLHRDSKPYSNKRVKTHRLTKLKNKRQNHPLPEAT